MDKWHELAPPVVKGERMPMTEEHFDKVCAMRDELIEELREQLATLKSQVNKLQQKLAKYKRG